MQFADFRDAIVRRLYAGRQSGRHFVALSLVEAESVRAVLHIAQGQTQLCERVDHMAGTSVALRSLAHASATRGFASALTGAVGGGTDGSSDTEMIRIDASSASLLDASDAYQAGEEYSLSTAEQVRSLTTPFAFLAFECIAPALTRCRSASSFFFVLCGLLFFSLVSFSLHLPSAGVSSTPRRSTRPAA